MIASPDHEEFRAQAKQVLAIQEILIRSICGLGKLALSRGKPTRQLTFRSPKIIRSNRTKKGGK